MTVPLFETTTRRPSSQLVKAVLTPRAFVVAYIVMLGLIGYPNALTLLAVALVFDVADTAAQGTAVVAAGVRPGWWVLSPSGTLGSCLSRLRQSAVHVAGPTATVCVWLVARAVAGPQDEWAAAQSVSALLAFVGPWWVALGSVAPLAALAAIWWPAADRERAAHVSAVVRLAAYAVIAAVAWRSELLVIAVLTAWSAWRTIKALIGNTLDLQRQLRLAALSGDVGRAEALLAASGSAGACAAYLARDAAYEAHMLVGSYADAARHAEKLPTQFTRFRAQTEVALATDPRRGWTSVAGSAVAAYGGSARVDPALPDEEAIRRCAFVTYESARRMMLVDLERVVWMLAIAGRWREVKPFAELLWRRGRGGRAAYYLACATAQLDDRAASSQWTARAAADGHALHDERRIGLALVPGRLPPVSGAARPAVAF